MGIEQRVIETRHGRISIKETDGKGHAILLIHGNSSCKEVFRWQLESELGRQYRMIAMDLQGHGESENASDPERSYTIPAYAETAVEVLRAREAGNAVVLGWSLGGHIGIEMIRLLPEMCALAFSGTPPAGPGEEELAVAFTPQPHMSLTSKEVFNEEEAKTYAKHIYGDDLSPDSVLSKTVKRTDGIARTIMVKNFSSVGGGYPQRQAVETWSHPIAVIQGSDEPFFKNSYLEGIKWGNLWEGHVHIVEGGGHAPFWARPDAYNEILARFLKDVTV